MSKGKNKMIKSAFLYGKPTKVKEELLKETLDLYRRAINYYIDALLADKKYYMAILVNANTAPHVRELEKTARKATPFLTRLASAYGQNAQDHAFTVLHNHFVRVKNKAYGYIINEMPEVLPYIESTALLNCAILDDNQEIATIINLILSEKEKEKPNEKTIEYYNELLKFLTSKTEKERKEMRDEVSFIFFDFLNTTKIPNVSNAPLKIDGRLCTIEEPLTVDADFVFSIKLIGSNDRIKIPVKTSKNSLRRMAQYKNGIPTITLKNGKIKISVPFTKKTKKIKEKELVLKGVDVGITDLFYTSDGQKFGTFLTMNDYYEKVLEPKLKNRSTLRNQMRTYQKELRKKSTSVARKDFLRKKIKNIADSLNRTNNLQKCQRSYHARTDKMIDEAVLGLIKWAKKEKVKIVFEDLDIKEFNRSRKANKRDSSWAKGKLVEKAIDKLNWIGIPTMKENPAYTSQTCPKCWHADKENRKGKLFKCQKCSHTDDADRNAAINIRNRATDFEVAEITEKYLYNRFKQHGAIKDLFKKRNTAFLDAIQGQGTNGTLAAK